MNKFLNYICGSLFLLATALPWAKAGNEDRIGQAGSTELLINPFARSSGWAGANTSNVKGLEAMFLNVAGTAFTKKTEFVFAHSRWLNSADININAFGFTQAVGKDKTGTLGMSVMSMNYGDILRSTEDQPEGGLGNYSPSAVNIGISYAKEFSNSIYGGLVVRGISQSISDVRAGGICFDAGVQYITGKNENIQFGIALRNVGPRLRFQGDGLSFRGQVPATGTVLTVEHRSNEFEMPAALSIGGSYAFNFENEQKLILAGNFQSNSFSRDQFMFGAEYNFMKIFMLRAGYMFEARAQNSLTGNIRTSAFTGPTAGFTIEAPMNKNKSTFGLDYSYRVTNPFGGVHSIGARINL